MRMLKYIVLFWKTCSRLIIFYLKGKTPGYVGTELPVAIRVNDDDLVKQFTFELK